MRIALGLVMLILNGCAAQHVKEDQISDIKYAYLVGREYLVVCVTGEVSQEAGDFSIRVPLNGEFLNPSFAVTPFGPVDYDNQIPQFRLPKALVTKGCDADGLRRDGISVPVVRDVVTPDLTRMANQSRSARREAGKVFVGSLRSRDKAAGTVYLMRQIYGQNPWNFVYASDANLIGDYKAVTVALPSTDLKRGPGVVDFLALPVALPVAAAITVANGVGPTSRGKLDQRAEDAISSVPPKWKAGTIDPLLNGKWRSIEVTRFYPVSGEKYKDDGFYSLEFEGDKIVWDIALGSSGYWKRQLSHYKLLDTGEYEFEITADSVQSLLVGVRGKAEYGFDGDEMHLTVHFADPATTGSSETIKAVYVRDRPRLLQD